MVEHRGSERGLYDRLQQPERQTARELLERLLVDPANTYDQICVVLNNSGLFEKTVTPQDLTRYRQRKGREESRASVMSLIEAEGETLLHAAAKNPTGVIAKYLRQVLAEHAVAKISDDIESLDAISVSREAARHALVEQRDRKLGVEEEKIELERKRIELQERQAELQRDKFGIAAKVYQYILSWLAVKEPRVADVMTKHSDELLTDLEGYIEANG